MNTYSDHWANQVKNFYLAFNEIEKLFLGGAAAVTKQLMNLLKCIFCFCDSKKNI